MNQKKRFQKLRKKWKELGVEDLEDDKLDEYEQELKNAEDGTGEAEGSRERSQSY